jgi:SAM-dependent methyltransferase
MGKGKVLGDCLAAVDLERIELPPARYDLVLNFNYLQRSLVPEIKQTLKPGGWVIFETYLIDQQAIGHPNNPGYLLGHNELLDLYYREGQFLQSAKSAFLARLLAQKKRS